MANNATFTEVLEIQVLTDKFADEMKKVEKIYADSLKNMPQLGNMGTAQFSQSITDLTKVIADLQKNGTSVMQSLGKVTVDTASNVEKAVNKMATTVSDSLKSVNQQVSSLGSGARQYFDSMQSGWGRFVHNLTNDIPGFLGNLIKVKLLWGAINEAINLTGSIIMAPFKMIKEGFDYLSSVQERSSQLQGQLLQSVEFIKGAKDDPKKWADNVRIAADEAKRLTMAIDDLAAKLGVKSQVIQAGFQSFLAYGGRNLTNNLDDALQVSGLATAALQAQNPNIQTRKLATEMQQLVQGAVTPSSKLAAALGVSADNLKQMVEHAKVHHDLLQQILEKSQGLEERIGSANYRQLSLAASVDLLKQRWEGLIAGPLFDRYVNFLQSIIAFVKAHEKDLNQLGQTWGQIIDAVASYVEDFIKNDWKDVVDAFKTIAQLAIMTATGIANIVNGIVATIKLATDFKKNWDETSQIDSNKDAKDKLAKEDFQNNKINYAEMSRRLDANRNEAEAARDTSNANWEASKNQSVGGFMNREDKLSLLQGKALNALDGMSDFTSLGSKQHQSWATTGINGKDEKGASDTKQFQADVEEMKLAYQQLREAAQESVSARKMSHREAADAITAYFDQERTAMAKLVADYKKKDPEHAATYDKAMAQFNLGADRQESAARKAANAETAQISKLHYNEMLKMAQEDAKEELATQQALYKDGYLTAVEFFDKKTEIQARQHSLTIQSLQEEVDATAKGTVEHEQALIKMDEANRAYQQQVRTDSVERRRLIEQEQKSLRDYGYELQRIDLEGQVQHSQTIANNAQTPADRYEAQRQILQLRQQEIDLNIKAAESELAIQKAKNGETDATRKLELELEKLRNSRRQSQYDINTQSASGPIGGMLGPGYNKVQVQGKADDKYAEYEKAFDLWKNATQQEGESTEQYNIRLEKLKENAQDLYQQWGTLNQIAVDLGSTFSDVKDALMSGILGADFKQAWDDADTGLQKFQVGLAGVANGLGAIKGVVNQYEQGRKQGGVLGGVGSLMSNGPVSDALSMIPYVGAFVKPLGQIFSFIGDMFTSAARKIAAQISKEIDNINKEYHNGQATLGATITALEKERQDAINKLSGQKGGKDQLNKLLPQLDDELTQLKKQADDTKTAFTQQLAILRAGTDVLGNWLKTWTDINKQVKDYLDAGGDLATANQFLTLQLAQQREQLNQSLQDGDKQAIQDAISLNDLIQQRIDLMKTEAKTEFGIETADAIEKRGSAAIGTGQDLATARANYNKQLDDLNSQIDLATQKLSLEKQVFQIASDTATLKQQANAIELQQLDLQMQKYQQMFQLLQATNGMTFNGQFNPNYTPGVSAAPTQAPVIPVTVQINGGDLGSNPEDTGDRIGQAIQNRLRSGRLMF